MRKIVELIVCFLILFSCSNGEERIKKVTCVSSVSEISDTLFFGKVKNLKSNGENIYFIDKYRGCIVHTNVNDWKLKRLIGVTGEGPDELCNLLQFTLKDDTLYALDGGCPKLVAYNLQGDICAKYPLPLESKLKIGYHFLVNGVTKFGIPPVLLFYQAHLLFLRVCPAHTFFDG
nr:6-bladed beta-propeller [uncultured Bacteroides sp.]